MIGRLTGKVVAQGEDGTVTLDVGGVGYEVTLPLGALGRARKEGEERVILHVHTIVREDAFLLYGFPSLEEREVFRRLLGVASVGPKIAISILGALSVEELATTVSRKELGRLTSISGVGRKTAERLLLELKDKLVPGRGAVAAPVGEVGPSGKVDLLRSALANMGFRPAEVERAVERVRDRIAAADLAELVREALTHVSP